VLANDIMGLHILLTSQEIHWYERRMGPGLKTDFRESSKVIILPRSPRRTACHSGFQSRV
jgi:hypothetical protein